MLDKEFRALGLNENEQEVYLAVLRAGKAAPTRISKETGINRTTVYSISRKLISLGLIGEDLGAKIAYLYAEKPAALEHIFAKEEQELRQKKEIAQKISQELSTLPTGKSYSVPRIKFIEETDLTEYLYQAYPRWAQSGLEHDNTWWGYIDNSFTKAYKEWIHWTWKQGPEGIKVRFFDNNNEIEKEVSASYKERKTRPLPEGGQFDSSMWVIGDYVLMTQSREHPHYLVEIHDSVFARNQRQLFKSLWGQDKK